MALTQLAVEKAKSKADRYELPDGLLVGLYLVVQPSGRKSWVIRYRHQGSPRKLTLGAFPILDLKEARDKGRLALQAVQEGRDPAAEKKAAKSSTPADKNFGAVARLFVERYAKPKNRSWKETARLLGLKPDPDNPEVLINITGGLAATWKDRAADDIGRSDVIDVLDRLIDRGAPKVANATLRQLRKLFNWSIERGLATSSPCSGMKPPAPEISRDRVLADNELRRAWLAADTIGWPFGPLVKLLILTGQREGEIAGMRWSEIDLEKRLWTIPGARTKNKRVHDVPLSDQAMAIVQALPKMMESDLLFTTNGRTPVSGFSRAKKRLDAAMSGSENSDRWTFHDLRRTMVSDLARLKINQPVIEKVVNHISGSFAGVVGVYQRHDFADEKRAALNAWARFVDELVTGNPVGNVVALRG